jgi:glycosyltransferase involved in cell wall biosynthesis
MESSVILLEEKNKRLLSIVVPCFNEFGVVDEFHRRLTAVLQDLPSACEIIYVNDGSRDQTMEKLRRLRGENHRVAIVDLSRNFGKEIAMTAGIDHAQGDAVIIIDADLQDPPELIPRLIEQWDQGFDVVYAKRKKRDGETILKKTTSYLFYRLIQKVSRVSIPADAGDYRLMSRRAVEALKALREHHRFMKGLFAWIGFPQTAVLYKRDPRFAGETKWNYWKLWNFAIEGITSFTIAPLKFATYSGVTIAGGSFLYAGVIIFKTLIYGNEVPGYPSLMVTILFLGGIQLVCIGILGEYLGRTFNETKQRPLYFVKSYEPRWGRGPDYETIVEKDKPASQRRTSLEL